MSIELISNLFRETLNYPHLVILSTLWISYSYIIAYGGFVSDDLQGIEQYDGTLIYPREDGKKDDKGQVIKEKKVCYGTLSKWVRYHLCGGDFPSHHWHKNPDGTNRVQIPSGKVPRRHHTLSLICQSIACILLYHFLLTVTTPLVSLLTVCLFIVHPTCLQAVAWPSAIGYILSLICICSSLLISTWTMSHLDLNHLLIGLVGITFFQVWGVYAQGIPLATCAIMLLLGQWQLAIISGIIAGAITFKNLYGYVTYRKEEFAKQAMDQSTSFSWRKPIVVLKTIAYYFYLTVWPARLGLYHTWGFHYDKEIERWDWRAISGLLFFCASLLALYYGPLQVKLGILWFYCFLFLFLNWITAQQWVTERYLYIPIIGLSLIASYYLQGFLPIYFLIFGMFLSRTLCHLGTYDNELRFYLSNTWNFPKSEVAYGNLGVAYASVGLSGASNDMWSISSHLNPDYDVPFYNMFSSTKSKGLMLIQHGAYEQGIQTLASSLPIMEKVLKCKVLHFKEMWTKEYNDLSKTIQNPTMFLMGEMNRLENVKTMLNNEMIKATDDKRRGEVLPSIKDNDVQIQGLKNYLSSKGVNVEFNPEKSLLGKLTQQRS